MFDLILRRGRIVDGTGAAWFEGELGIQGDRIAAIGDLKGAGAARVIDLDGAVVAPGFIDIHTHSDFPLLVNPRAEAKIRQGVTTELLGNCGLGLAPLSGGAARTAEAEARRYGVTVSWRSMAQYLDRLQAAHPSVNCAALIGLGPVREGVMGGADRPPTPDELAGMAALVDQAMSDGAFGISSGLIYPPGCFASTDEVVELARVAARHGGFYATHIRNEYDDVIPATAEALAIGERAGIPVQLSHHKAMGTANWGKVKSTIAMIEEARARGLDVTMDQYPYTASATGLSSVLPQWAHEGGREAMLARLRDPGQRARIAAEAEIRVQKARGGWEKILIAAIPNPALSALEGKKMSEVAAAGGTEPVQAAIDLLLEGGAVGMVAFGMAEEDVRYVMQHPLTMIGSDGSAIAPYGILGEGKPHPRSYGTFARVLGRYVREEKLLPLEEAVRKMTSLPARRLGLWDRGIIRPGMAADLAVFDPAAVADRADFVNPHQYAAGVHHVIVNGLLVVEAGEHTGAAPGRVFRRQALRP